MSFPSFLTPPLDSGLARKSSVGFKDSSGFQKKKQGDPKIALFFPVVQRPLFGALGLKVFVYGFGSALSSPHGEDDGRGTRYDITTRKDADL